MLNARRRRKVDKVEPWRLGEPPATRTCTRKKIVAAGHYSGDAIFPDIVRIAERTGLVGFTIDVVSNAHQLDRHTCCRPPIFVKYPSGDRAGRSHAQDSILKSLAGAQDNGAAPAIQVALGVLVSNKAARRGNNPMCSRTEILE